ncbi:hypothetical protein WISP_87319 [Willisornis vidua]|uniref:Uncharacterized protein n=1 Tax=Willisornis vidua TaxID=1566151 RepID=A0ABQ9D2R1_9PASS|nr:hypothetical protein WISP_87319 [Willisornis vidua]
MPTATRPNCYVYHYLLNVQWSFHQDHYTWSLREVASTAKSRETKLQASQEKTNAKLDLVLLVLSQQSQVDWDSMAQYHRIGTIERDYTMGHLA